MKNSIYNDLLKFIENLKEIYKLGKNIDFSSEHEYDIYSFKNNEKEKIDFYLCLSKDLNNPRIELQLANPFSENKNDYLIVGEFYDFNEKELEDIVKIVKTFLSNKVKIANYILNKNKIKTEYSYGYYSNNKTEILSESFNNKAFIFPWNRKKIIKKVIEFKPWIESECTIIG